MNFFRFINPPLFIYHAVIIFIYYVLVKINLLFDFSPAFRIILYYLKQITPAYSNLDYAAE